VRAKLGWMVLLVVSLAAGGDQAGSVKLSYFGEVAIADGEVAVMDGGIHGVQGHTLRIDRDGGGRWERRVESLQPSGKPGAGTFKPSPDELKSLRAWADRLWSAAGTKGGSYFPPPDRGPPRWVWAIALRRGGEVRTLEGGAMAPTDGAPADARELLAWTIAKVDELGARSP
jgi:hypothetical protein